jgi:serine/threonine-protein kinase PpkA
MQIPGYTIQRKIGQGGMAEVYLAIQESLGRQVALKVTSKGQSQDPAFKERFLQEGRIVATLNHPNIVTIHEIGQEGEHYFIAMEYVAGQSLSEKIERGITFKESVQTIKKIARALAYAHKGGFLHRDIKPSNILFRDDEYAVLADFGIATAMVEDDIRLTLTGMSPGSPAYMSPEQVNGDKLDGRSDQYSLGIVFYEMLTGDRPFKGKSATATAILHLMAPVPQLPYPYEALQPIFDRLLAKVPDDRFTDENELLEALDKHVSVEAGERMGDDTYVLKVASHTQVRVDTCLSPMLKVRSSRSGVPIGMWRWGGVAAFSVALLMGAVVWLKISLRTADIPLKELQERSPDFQLDKPKRADAKVEGRVLQPPDFITYEPSEKLKLVAVEPGSHKISPVSPYVSRADVRGDKRPKKVASSADQRANQLGTQESMDSQAAKIEADLTQSADTGTELEALLVTAKTQKQIEGLLIRAKTQLKGQRLARPKGDNAYESYQSVLALDANHSQAQEGLKLIAKRYEEFAKNKHKAGDLMISLAMAERGLEVDPKHAGLLALRKNIASLLDEEYANKSKVDQLLSLAQKQFKEGKLTRPKSGNAQASYSAVLEMEPNNQAARTGLRAIMERYYTLAHDKQSSGKTAEALTVVEEGLRAFPQHTGLRELHREIDSQLEGAKHVERLPERSPLAVKKARNKKLGTRVFGTF